MARVAARLSDTARIVAGVIWRDLDEEPDYLDTTSWCPYPMSLLKGAQVIDAPKVSGLCARVPGHRPASC